MAKISTILFGGQSAALHIASLVQPHDDIVLLASTASADDLLKQIRQYLPQIVLLEAAPDLPDVVPLIAYLVAEIPPTRCIVLTHQCSLRHIQASIASGAMG